MGPQPVPGIWTKEAPTEKLIRHAFVQRGQRAERQWQLIRASNRFLAALTDLGQSVQRVETGETTIDHIHLE